MFQFVLDTTDAGIRQFVIGAWQAFATQGNPLFISLLVIGMCLIGYRVWFAQQQMTFSDAGFRLLQMFAIYALIVSVPNLTAYFYELFTEAPASIADFMVGVRSQSTGDINAGIEDILSRGTSAGGAIWRDAGITSLPAFGLGFFVYLLTLTAVIVVTLVLVVAKIAIATLLGIAPLMLLLYIFPATRALTQGWLRQLITFALVPILLYSAIGLMFGMMDAASAEIFDNARNDRWNLETCGAYAIVTAIWSFVAGIIVPYSAGIAGGFALSVPSVAGGAGLPLVSAGAQRAQLLRRAYEEGGARGAAGAAVRDALGVRQRPNVERYRDFIRPVKGVESPPSAGKRTTTQESAQKDSTTKKAASGGTTGGTAKS